MVSPPPLNLLWCDLPHLSELNRAGCVARGAGKHPHPAKMVRPEFQDYTHDFRLARLEAHALPMSKMHRKPRPDPSAMGRTAGVRGHGYTSENNQHSVTTSTLFGCKQAHPTHRSMFVGTCMDSGPVMPTGNRNDCAAICTDVKALVV